MFDYSNMCLIFYMFCVYSMMNEYMKKSVCLSGDSSMSNRNITNIFSASVRAKLHNKARESKKPFTELLQYFAIERFLYRYRFCTLSKIFFKGALMFTT